MGGAGRAWVGWGLACSLALACLLALACSRTEAPERAPNLLLVTIDTLRADHVSAYGYERPTTPAIDRVAAEGVLFRNTMAPRGETWPSLSSVLTSLAPDAHGVRRNGDARRAEARSLAEQLQDAGFATAAFLTNMTSVPHPGFDQVETWGVEAQREHGQHGADALAADAALRWIRAHDSKGAPFFVWVHLIGPHDPYELPAGRARRFDTGYRGERDASRLSLTAIYKQKLQLSAEELAHLVSLYDDDVAAADQKVGRLLESLDSLGLAGDTLVAVNGDHGEELYDHDSYFLHSWSVHDSVLAVPLLLRLPDRLPAGAQVEALVENVDIAPTLLELLGVAVPETFQGQSLLPLLPGFGGSGSDGERTGVAYGELGPAIRTVRTERWRYVSNPERRSSPGLGERDNGHRPLFEIPDGQLFDLEADPRALVDVSGEHPEVVRRLQERLHARLASAGPSSAAPLPDETRAELQALGYLEPEASPESGRK